MMNDRLLDLDRYPEDALLAELRSREARSLAARRPFHESALGQLDHPASTRSAGLVELRDVSSRSIFEALRRSQTTRYGVDDRRDLYRVEGPASAALRGASAGAALQGASAVAALFRSNHVQQRGDGWFSLETRPLGARFGLCGSEPFVDQPSGAFGTGFLVAPKLIATAGHCVDPQTVTKVCFVFGFRMLDDDRCQVLMEQDDVYRGARLVERRHDLQGADWALVELDREVVGRRPLPIRRSGRVADGAPLYVLGHPSGLPLKYADGAAVRDNSPDTFFVANLDTYAGSSGSPVFGPDHQVEGIVSRGERDFVLVGNCYRSLVVPDNGGRGQDCTRITELAALVAT